MKTCRSIILLIFTVQFRFCRIYTSDGNAIASAAVCHSITWSCALPLIIFKYVVFLHGSFPKSKRWITHWPIKFQINIGVRIAALQSWQGSQQSSRSQWTSLPRKAEFGRKISKAWIGKQDELRGFDKGKYCGIPGIHIHIYFCAGMETHWNNWEWNRIGRNQNLNIILLFCSNSLKKLLNPNAL